MNFKKTVALHFCFILAGTKELPAKQNFLTSDGSAAASATIQKQKECFTSPLNSQEDIKEQIRQSNLPPSHKDTFLREEAIELKTKDGLIRKGNLTLRKKARGNVVLCHAAGYDRSTMEPFIEKIFTEYNCIRFDFRRHGENADNQYSTIGKKEAYEVLAAIDFFKNHPETKNLSIYGYGQSMGAAALLHAENIQPTFKGLILQSCYEKLRTQIKHHFKAFQLPILHGLVFTTPVRLFSKVVYKIKAERFNPEELISTVQTPLFLIHAQNDKFTPFKAYQRLTEKAKPATLKLTWAPKLGGHSKIFSTYPEEYTQKCTHFLKGLC